MAEARIDQQRDVLQPFSLLQSIGSFVALKVYIQESMIALTCFGPVRHCQMTVDGNGYLVGVQFLDIKEESEKLLARHIIACQNAERRAQLRKERVGQP